MLSVACFAQIQGNRPDVIDSTMDDYQGSTHGVAPYIEGFSSGQLLVVFGHARSEISVAPTVDDDGGVGNTYTCTTPVTTPAPGDVSKKTSAFICYSVAAGTVSSASVTAHCTNLNGCWIEAARFNGLSGTPDGSATSGTGTGGDGTSESASITTTKSGDVIVCNATRALYGTLTTFASGSTMESLASHGNDVGYFANMIHADTIGTYSCDYSNIVNTGDTSTWVVQALAFQPSSVRITDTVMPDGAVSVAYSAQLHGVGGTAAFTCSISVGSLPTGLSLGGTGNCTISGTPSGSPGTTNFTAHIDDGAGHTASQALSIKIGSIFAGTPLLRGSVTFKPLGGASTESVSGVQCGDVIVITTLGNETFDNNGYINTLTGTNNYWSGSLGETYYRVPGIGGTKNAPGTTFVSTPITAAGPTTDIISYSASTLNGTHAGLFTVISVIANVQQGVDPGAIAYAGHGAGSLSISTSMTTLVPNSFVYEYWLVSNNGLLDPANWSASPGGSFTLIAYDEFNQGAGLAAYNVQAAAGTSNGSVSSSGSNETNFVNIATRNLGMMAFRPALPASCAASFSGNGERINRQIF